MGLFEHSFWFGGIGGMFSVAPVQSPACLGGPMLRPYSLPSAPTLSRCYAGLIPPPRAPPAPLVVRLLQRHAQRLAAHGRVQRVPLHLRALLPVLGRERLERGQLADGVCGRLGGGGGGVGWGADERWAATRISCTSALPFHALPPFPPPPPPSSPHALSTWRWFLTMRLAHASACSSVSGRSHGAAPRAPREKCTSGLPVICLTDAYTPMVHTTPMAAISGYTSAMGGGGGGGGGVGAWQDGGERVACGADWWYGMSRGRAVAAPQRRTWADVRVHGDGGDLATEAGHVGGGGGGGVRVGRFVCMWKVCVHASQSGFFSGDPANGQTLRP